jgi:hypothetical protein
MDIGDDLGAFVEDFDDGLAADGDQAQQEPGAREELGATFDDVLNNFIQVGNTGKELKYFKIDNP